VADVHAWIFHWVSGRRIRTIKNAA
jgi:hypothetical protein